MNLKGFTLLILRIIVKYNLIVLADPTEGLGFNRVLQLPRCHQEAGHHLALSRVHDEGLILAKASGQESRGLNT